MDEQEINEQIYERQHMSDVWRGIHTLCQARKRETEQGGNLGAWPFTISGSNIDLFCNENQTSANIKLARIMA